MPPRNPRKNLLPDFSQTASKKNKPVDLLPNMNFLEPSEAQETVQPKAQEKPQTKAQTKAQQEVQEEIQVKSSLPDFFQAAEITKEVQAEEEFNASALPSEIVEDNGEFLSLLELEREQEYDDLLLKIQEIESEKASYRYQQFKELFDQAGDYSVDKYLVQPLVRNAPQFSDSSVDAVSKAIPTSISAPPSLLPSLLPSGDWSLLPSSESTVNVLTTTPGLVSQFALYPEKPVDSYKTDKEERQNPAESVKLLLTKEEEFVKNFLGLSDEEIGRMKAVKKVDFLQDIFYIIRVPKLLEMIKEVGKDYKEGGLNFDFAVFYSKIAFRRNMHNIIKVLYENREFIRKYAAENNSSEEEIYNFLSKFHLLFNRSTINRDGILSSLSKTMVFYKRANVQEFCESFFGLNSEEIKDMKVKTLAFDFIKIISSIQEPALFHKLKEIKKDYKEGGIGFDFVKFFMKYPFLERLNDAVEFFYQNREYIRTEIAVKSLIAEKESDILQDFYDKFLTFGFKVKCVFEDLNLFLRQAIDNSNHSIQPESLTLEGLDAQLQERQSTQVLDLEEARSPIRLEQDLDLQEAPSPIPLEPRAKRSKTEENPQEKS